MTTLSRSEFRNTLAQAGGTLNVHDLPKTLEKKLTAAGIDGKQLERIAGRDGQIGGREFDKLFDAVETVDDSGSRRSFEAGTDRAPTQAGEIYDALKGEVDRRRNDAHLGVIHLGMRSASKEEVAALTRANSADKGGVVTIAAHAHMDTIEHVDHTGRKHDIDLQSPGGLRDFATLLARETGNPRQATRFVDLLRRQGDGARDELAQFGVALLRSEKQKTTRMVLSGHSFGGTLFGGPHTPLPVFTKVAKLFPEGAGRIKHVMLSACNTGYKAHVDLFRSAFPNLKSYAGYVGPSPDAEGASPAHVRHWEGRTDGDDPNQVDPGMRNMATWNVADGRQEQQPLTLRETRELVAHSKSKVDSTVGNPHQHERSLYNYYQALTRLTYHADMPASERPGLHALAIATYGLYNDAH